ncbi:MAG: restriction endonuclease subunit R, partial [Bacteroidales bacterium]|nr:restriction endonuclease subunit R [Bacteroidales bacterium]
QITKGTKLTRKTVGAILKGIKPEKFLMFKQNPEQFIAECTRLINEQKATKIVDGIKYDITQEPPYENEIFTDNSGVLDFNRAIQTTKHITPYVIADSDVETNMTHGLEASDDVCVYAKLPRSFKIPTPVGDYAPDWAITFYEGRVKYIYFVAETKGSMSTESLRPVEAAKLTCASKLFEKLSSYEGEITYKVVKSFDALMNEVMNARRS